MVVLSKTLRDIDRSGLETLGKLAESAAKIVDDAIASLSRGVTEVRKLIFEQGGHVRS
ncbi:DUF269 domain-containing protein [Sinorhizobium americanum]|uniref:DUF269 domain-containing protein n=1 Tax=Sinorhizobium americanum TaxID=194963 RepID=UPI001F341FFE|nr:hypothetical protein [Sinorhizobium americanum]